MRTLPLLEIAREVEAVRDELEYRLYRTGRIELGLTSDRLLLQLEAIADELRAHDPIEGLRRPFAREERRRACAFPRAEAGRQ